jgi:hypothetical protein
LTLALTWLDTKPSCPAHHSRIRVDARLGGIPAAVYLLENQPLYWVCPDMVRLNDDRIRGRNFVGTKTFEWMGPFDTAVDAVIFLKLLAD